MRVPVAIVWVRESESDERVGRMKSKRRSVLKETLQ